MQHRRIAVMLALCLVLSFSSVIYAASPLPTSNRIIALAVHVETPKQEWPGLSGLREKIIETVVAKLSTMVINQIISGSGVMEKLQEFGVDNLESVDASRLAEYGRQNNISYIVMFSLRTSDFSYSLKGFDVSKGSFLYDGASQAAPAQTSSWSLSDLTLSPTQLFMKKVVPVLDGQLTALLKLFD